VRLITLPSRGGYECILLEDMVGLFADRFFPGETVVEHAALRITRNADMGVREDLAFDLLSQMEAVLDERKRSECVRLEIDAAAKKTLEGPLAKLLEVRSDSVYRLACPIDLAALNALCDLKGYADLLNEPWPPQQVPDIAAEPDVLGLIAKRDLLLYHPFESFEPFVRFIQQAAADPDVVAIKQVLYRTSRTSPITAALMQAAQAGKYVTVIIELKARFDEARNIEWAQELEDAGVQVVYGVKGLKTHAKICIVIRREGSGLRRYMHFGTGNYNEMTARLYTDVSYLTADEDLGADASAFFNAVTGYSQPRRYLKLEAAPIGLRDRLVELIEAETERRKQGQEAWIRAKMNSLVDQKTIRALYDASEAGVKIELNVRGVCCLRAGVPGLSDNIRVVSIVDRCLEHSRIFAFCNGGDCRVFISSADWMPRNFDKRVELLVPVEEPGCRERLMAILTTCLADTAHAWEMKADGSYARLGADGRRNRVRSQEEFYRQALSAIETAKKARPTMFEAHRPQGAGP
jgi:polyphosphate kinase